MRRKKARLPLLFVVIILIAYAINFYVENSSISRIEESYVTKVVDGDTIVVEGGQRVRLLSIDARERGESCYSEAKSRLEQVVLLKNVTLERDKENKDQYGRLLRYVFVGDTLINLQLVEEGLAVAYIFEPNVRYRAQLVEAEKKARAAEGGCVWANAP